MLQYNLDQENTSLQESSFYKISLIYADSQSAFQIAREWLQSAFTF